MKGRFFLAVISVLILLCSLEITAFAAANQSTSLIVVQPVRESAAYQQYKNRPDSDNSKLIYLIERLGDAPIEVLYDGHYFKAPFVAKVARWFLGRHYRKETVKQWIMKWCNASVPGGNLIWVKMSDGKFKLSREVLSDELKLLEETIKEDALAPPAAALVMPIATVSPVTGNRVSQPSKIPGSGEQNLNPGQTAAA